MDNSSMPKEEWISVSELAKRMNVTSQTIYNRISKGDLKTKEFTRGKMRGLLVCSPQIIEY